MTVNPSADSASSATMRNVFSSSITRTVGFMWRGPRRGSRARRSDSGVERQPHAEERAAQLGGADVDGAAVRLDETARGRQPEAGAVRLGGEERLEQVRARLRRQPRAVVGDLDARLAVARADA